MNHINFITTTYKMVCSDHFNLKPMVNESGKYQSEACTVPLSVKRIVHFIKITNFMLTRDISPRLCT